jgi:DNA-binding ferritin-like protein
MQIEIIRTNENTNITSTVVFGNILNNITSSIKMLHWYAVDYNVHTILGDLYDSLTELFDKLQEEIIGIVKSNNVLFPAFNSNDLIINDIDHNSNSVDYYFEYLDKIKNTFSSVEFDNFLNSNISGINNTKEEIISSINKANYLLLMVNKTH